MAGKQSRNSFQSQVQPRAENILGVIHSDMCGPFEVPSLGGNKYFITFVDEFSRILWIYLIKTKDEALETLKNFKVKIGKQSGESIKVLRTDRGGKYTSHEFKDFLCQELN